MTIRERGARRQTVLEIDSPEPPERVARVVRNAERGCFVIQALRKPVAVAGRTMLNGVPLPTDQSG